ncbi:SRPBCC family protein [Actinomadura sp. 1N219]|uniref:SRPBCC family protein n=1 Tax=Actinomadura sp. 1N219 TaxID=3375152 RepID=UPI0037AF3E22
MKRGNRMGRLPVGTITKRLPGRRGRRIPGLGGVNGIAKNLPGKRTAGTAGGVLLGAGAAVAANRALSGRRNGQGSSGEADAQENEQKKRKGKAKAKAAGKNSEQSGPGVFGRLKGTAAGVKSTAAGVKDTATGVLPGIGQNGSKDEAKGDSKDGAKGGGKGGGKKVKVTNIVEHIDIGAPRRLVYDQWTRFQDYPSFMKKVVSVDQTEDGKLHWKAKIFWSSRTWESTIVEQVPDEHIVWRSKGSKGHVDGTVSFHKLSPNLTRVLLVLEYHPQGLFERTANMWRAQGRRVRLELKHFRRFVMTQSLTRPDDVEGWRGEIHDSEVVRTHDEALDEEERDRRDREKEYEEAR